MSNHADEHHSFALTLVLILFGFAMVWVSPSPSQAAVPTAPGSTYPANAYVVQVDGLACPFCAYGIEKQFSHLSGVTHTNVDLASGVVIVHVKAGTRFDRAQIVKTVKAAGFSLKKIVAEPPR